MINFRIIENSPPAYMEKYEEFISLYNNPEITVEDIRRKLGWRTKVYNDARRKALADGLIKDRRTENMRKNNKGRPSNPKFKPKHYCFDRGVCKFKVSKRYYINKKEVSVYYGCYDKEDDARRIVEELKKVDWDKEKLPEIIEKLGIK